uniref:Uncharacterized protein n=1 Tax=Panagrolaimus superbus TaxID=310955 RepID=A0A914XSZ5_9BILA
MQNRKRKLKIIDENSGKNGILINLKENDVIKDGYEIELSNDTIDFSPIKKKIKLQSTVLTDAENFVAYSNFAENNSFKITIEKEKLKSGTLNYTEIYGIDSTKMPLFDQLFYLPITVILPRILTNEDGYCIKEENLELKPNFPHRFFILSPKECFQCVVKVFVKTLASLYLQYSTENCTVESGTGKWLEFNEEINFQTYDIQINGNKIHEIAIFPDCYKPCKM